MPLLLVSVVAGLLAALGIATLLVHALTERSRSIHTERLLLWHQRLDGAAAWGSWPLASRQDQEAAVQVLVAKSASSLFRSSPLYAIRQEHLRSGNQWTRAEAALTLGRLGCTEAQASLALLLQGDGTPAHIAAIIALSLVGDYASVEPLSEYLNRQGRRRARLVLLALIRCGASNPASLAGLLKHSDSVVRAAAAGALAETATVRETPDLAAAASDADPQVRTAVARALGKAGGEARATLAQLAGDPVFHVRLNAIRALSNDDEVFWRLIEDPDWRVREEAVIALRKRIDDPLTLLQAFRQKGADRYAIESLISVLEREGVIWRAICEPGPGTRDLLSAVLKEGKSASIRYALEQHPNAAVRSEMSDLLREYGGSAPS